MSGTTTNNGWTYPTSTDYVKDGATAIQTLATGIDTSTGTGLLAWTTYTPTVTPGGGAITSYVLNRATYAKLGKIVHINISITITNNGTGTGAINMTLPASANAKHADWAGVGRETAATGNQLAVWGNGTAGLSVRTYNNNYPGGTNYVINISGTYEAA